MSLQFNPLISIIMPVFNTGQYLLEAINSVLNQKPGSIIDELPQFELVIVDDGSTDEKTIEILAQFSNRDPQIKIVKNQRTKGAAGARNTGILVANGQWIGFLDSDDIWLSDSLAIRWKIISENENIYWLAAKFQLLKSSTKTDGTSYFESADSLIKNNYPSITQPEILLLAKPVEIFSDSCIIGIMTVFIRRDLIIEKGLFNEKLPRAEDYHLWFKCAFDHDLYLANISVSFYRIHAGSLTHGNHPKYLHEDTMIELLLLDPIGRLHKKTLLKRFDISMQEQCYFYREHRQFSKALTTALRWTLKRPVKASPWKEVIASTLRVS